MSDADRVLAAALAAGTHTTPTPQTALSKLRAGRSVLKTGVAALDCMLRGGFPCRSLSELCGEAGSGKTQLLLQLLVRSQMTIKAGGLSRKAVYISTEGEPPTARLMQMAEAHVAAFPKAFERGHPLDHIFVEKVHSPAELEQLISVRLPALLELMPVGLIVLDSIAAPMRGDESYCGIEDSAARAGLLMKLGSLLKAHASRFNCAIVVANQVSDLIRPDEHANKHAVPTEGGQRRDRADDDVGERRSCGGKVAAMGLAWSQAINTRVVLRRCGPRNAFLESTDHGGGHNQGGNECGVEPSVQFGFRQAELFMSPWASNGACKFRIATAGIVSVDEPSPFETVSHQDRDTCCPESETPHIRCVQ